MTKTIPDRATLVVAKRLWHNNGFLEPGSEWAETDTDQSPVDEKLVRHYLDTGFLQDRDALEKERNAEAYAARREVADKDAKIKALENQLESLKGQAPPAPDLSEVLTVLPGVKSLADVVKQVKALQAKSGKPAPEPDLSAVAALLPGVKTLADLPGAVQALQTQLATQQALQPGQAGTSLPPNFKCLGALKKVGLGTWESLQGKTAEQLNAVEGVTLEDATGIVDKVAAHFAQPE